MRLRWLGSVLCLLLWLGTTQAQVNTNDVQLRTQAGYDGYFRSTQWVPLRIEVSNSGSALVGRLIVRPAASGRALSNGYSTPLDLPSGADKTAYLYIQARDFARQIIVEFVTDDGVRVAQETVTLNAIASRDKLFVVLTGETASTLALGDVHPSGQQAYTVRWEAQNLPENAQALSAIDVIFLSNLEEDALTEAQRNALTMWVYQGGHLIAMGGANWQGVNDAVGALLPLQPTRTETLSDISAFGGVIGRNDDLNARTVSTRGDLVDGAQVLVQQDDIPLLVRHMQGDGVVDYLTIDPLFSPLASWAQAPQFWFSVLASAPIPNAWGRGFLNTDDVANAIAILPNEQLLPPAEALIGFIVAYILAIGPLNYIVLTRIKRQEWAWVTIPLCIILFSVIASVVGFNLRGNEVIVSRLRVVRVWDDAELALEQSVFGVLSPRRDVFSLTPDDNRFIKIMPSIGQNASNLQSPLELQQTDRFVAQGFSTDGGIFSNFSTERTVEKPNISGQLTLTTNSDNTQTVQGSIRNDTELTLENAVLLTRGIAYYLPPIGANELVTLDAGMLTLANVDGVPIPSRMENNTTAPQSIFALGRTVGGRSDELQTANDVLMDLVGDEDTVTKRVYLRREAFLKSFIRNQYNSPLIGDEAYLLAWTHDIPRDLTIENAEWRSVDDTLYIVKLALSVEQAPATQTLTLAPDQFVWTMQDRLIATDSEFVSGATALSSAQGGIDDIILNPDEGFAVKFTPLPTAKLAEVDSIQITFVRASGFANQIQLALWNWTTQTWDIQDLKIQEYTVTAPQPYVGMDGSVQLRMISTYPTGTSRIRDLKITMTGHY